MITSVTLKNYRNLNIKTTLDPHANIIIAPNGYGKSNFLEALYFCSLAKSFRPIRSLSEFLGGEKDFTKVEVTTDTDRIEEVVAILPRQQRKFRINGKVTPMTKFVGHLPLILFAPHSVNLVSDDPAERRQDLDDFLSILDNSYARNLSKYGKVLKNRNALLKHIRDQAGDLSQLKYWTSELVKLASEIFKARHEFFQSIMPFIKATGPKIYINEGINNLLISYKPNTSDKPSKYKNILIAKFEENQEKEIMVGNTLYGPHKDDYSILYSGQDLKYLGSRGEQRLGVLIWKLAQHQYLLKKTGKKAILLIDDLMSELDADHRQKVSTFLMEQDGYQFILTSADKTDIPNTLITNSKLISLE